MLEGIGGTLVSNHFLAEGLHRQFGGELGEAERERARVACRRIWRGASNLGPATAPRAVFDLVAAPLATILGFAPSSPRGLPADGFLLGRLGATSAEQVSAGAAGAPPLMLVTAWGDNLSAAWRRAVRETLAAGAAWCISINGRHVRLSDTRRSCVQRYLEFDLEAVCEDETAFAAFWGLLRDEAFAPIARGSPRRAEPLIERVVRASAQGTIGVCRSLRTGVLQAVGDLMDGLFPRRSRAAGDEDERRQLAALHEQALTIVYRTLFLLFAESRGLVPTWHPTYRRSYSMEAARSLAESSGPARGLWETLQAMSRLAHAGCRAGTLRVTPFNGRLFSPGLTPAGESGRLGDECARQMVLSLTTAPGAKGAPRARIVYRDLGVEQLGSVYEAVLDYGPVLVGPASVPTEAVRAAACLAEAGKPRSRACLAEAAQPRRRVRLLPGSGLRKATGTFYTPSPITSFIVRRALWPLVSNATPEAILGLRVLDPAMGSGAFLVAACRYLAGAYEEALVATGRYHPSDIGDEERRGFRRLVAQHCLYGVDLNPTAVQLARLSLWLATLAPDRPLTFLDHRLLVGDSLLGASLDDIARQPFPGGPIRTGAPGRAAAPLFESGQAEAALRAVLPTRLRLAATPDDSVRAVREKEQLLVSVGGPASPLAPWKRAADAWCALAFGLDSGERPPAAVFPVLLDHLAGRASALPARAAEHLAASVEATARAHRFFHYSLEFPEAFFEEDGAPRRDGGFDAVLGNPPWDMIREDNPGRTERGASRQASAGARVGARDRSDSARLARFARGSGVYRPHAAGHRNRFQLFVERAIALARPGGRIGFVVPSGLLTDCGCAPLRRLLFDRSEIDGLVGFDNADRIFPIHRSVRFVVFTATAGSPTTRLPCRAGERDPSVLDGIPDRGGPAHFGLVLARSLLERVSGDDLAVPDIRHPADLALLDKLMAAAPPLGAPEGWNVRFGRELNATDDRGLFERGGEGIPVVEGKHVHPFRVLLPADPLRIPPERAEHVATLAASFGRPRLAYRDVACATNRLTSIAAIVPAGHATVHTLFCLKTPLPERDQLFLCAVLNSLVVNFLVRLRVATHVTTGIVTKLPVPRPPSSAPCFDRIASLASGLALSPDPERDHRYAGLQAEVARLYGLSGEELEHVLAGFPLIDGVVKERLRAAWRAGGEAPGGSSMAGCRPRR